MTSGDKGNGSDILISCADGPMIDSPAPVWLPRFISWFFADEGARLAAPGLCGSAR